MARILLVTWAGGGNVGPALALAARLTARGHDVRAIGSEPLTPRFEAIGVEYRSRAPLTEWDPTSLADDVRDAARPCDLVVADHMLPASLCGAEAAGLPVIALVHTLYAANRDGAGGLVSMGMAGSLDTVDDVRRGLGLPSVPSFGALLDRAASVMVTCPEQLDTDGHRASNVRYVGALLEPAGPDDGWRPPGVDDGRPLVVASLGTTPMDELPVVRRVVAGLAAAPVRGLVTLGEHLDPVDVGAPGDGVHLSGYVRHAAVLPWASAVVTHAGLGTILAALAAGLPLVCLPLGREQPANAEAVVRAGAGIALPADAPADVVAAAVRRAVSDFELRAGAARLALVIDELVTSDAAVHEVERHL